MFDSNSSGNPVVVPSKGGDSFLDQHAETCPSPKRCACCALARGYCRWRNHLSDLPWLGYRPRKDGTIGIGCVICWKAGLSGGGAYAQFDVPASELRLSRLQRHEASDVHTKAWSRVSEQTGLAGPKIAQDKLLDAPSAEVFGEALRRRLDGLSCEDCGVFFAFVCHCF